MSRSRRFWEKVADDGYGVSKAGRSMATISAPAVLSVTSDQVVELSGLDWTGYSKMLRLRGGRSMPRIVYLDGSLLLISPSVPHERLKQRLGLFVSELTIGLRLSCVQTGQTTFRRQGKRGGVEGDQSYYLANADRIKGKRKLDLGDDPPPDLAIEVVHSHDASAALEVYRRLGVPEVWICDEAELQILVLHPEDRYEESPVSRAFPFLQTQEISSRVCQPMSDDDSEWGADLRLWVRESLEPRLQGRTE